MYGNDYSWVPSALAFLAVTAAAGAALVPLVRHAGVKRALLVVWMGMPFFGSVALGVVAAVYGQNLEPLTPIFIVLILTVLLLLPWTLPAVISYGLSRALFRRLGWSV